MTMMESATELVIDNMANEPFGGNGSVRIWFANIDEHQPEKEQLAWLSTSEHARAARLKNPLDRRRYLASHIFTRRVLSGLTGIAPGSLELLIDKCGKPFLSLPTVSEQQSSPRSWRFSVSDSENFLCIGAVLRLDVGVDIEVVNPDLNVLAISQACLDREDYEQVRRSFPNERIVVFHRLWTQREAFAKMLGHGIASGHVHRTPAPRLSLRSFELTLSEKQIVGALAISA